MKLKLFIQLLCIHLSYGVIYRLNESEYLRMPPVYHLDEYESCLHLPNGTYCYAEFDLVSDSHSQLLQMIHEYSEHSTTHFNHTRIHYGICFTKNCQPFIQKNTTQDHKLALEGCLNESLWRDYKLKARLSNSVFCKKLDDPLNINTGDLAAAVFFVLLFLLNVIGSLYGFYFIKEGKANRLLLSFSVKNNWRKLISHEINDPLRERMKGIHGLRTMSIMLVILAHSPLPIILSVANSHDFEKTYDNFIFHVFYNGTLIVQTFFIITGCLMAFNIRSYAENNQLSWVLIPKGILMRWLRITPAYAVVLIFTLTWMRFMGSGPLWEVAVGSEVADCMRDGWTNMVYLNNYVDNSQCMAQTWYLASDMQLYILGLFVCILGTEQRARRIILLVLFVIGCIIPGIHTYFQDLDAILLITPEVGRTTIVKSPTFNHSYKRGHDNIPGMVFGLVLGELVYRGLKDQNSVKKFKKLGVLYYLTFPMGVALIVIGMVFYGDRPRPSIYLRAVVASLVRPMFGLLVVLFFIGMVFKFENVYRPIVEWPGWRIPARVSYSAYIIHVTIIRIFAGMNTNLMRIGLAQCFKEAFGMITLTFLLAYPFWLFVEAPLNQALLIILGLNKPKKEKENGDQVAQKAMVDLDGVKGEEINMRFYK